MNHYTTEAKYGAVSIFTVKFYIAKLTEYSLPIKLNLLSHREKMAEDRIKLPCLDEKAIDGKQIHKHLQGLERFEQYTKRKYETDIGPLIKKGTNT